MKLKLMKGLFSVTLALFVITIVAMSDMLVSNASMYSSRYLKSHTKNMKEEITTNGSAHNIYYGQLHSHSTFSDGEGTCEEAYKYASTVPKNMDFFAVTDHSQRFDNHKKATITDASVSTEWKQGHLLAKKYTTSKFIGLYAYEMTWNASLGIGHMNTFNTPGFETAALPKFYNSDTGMELYYETLKKAPNSLSQFNHPSPKWGHFKDFKYVSTEVDKLIHMLEMPGFHKTNDIITYCKYYQRALDKGWHVSPTNNQDNHGKDWGTLNAKRSVLLSKQLSQNSIYDALRHNRTYSTEDIDFYLKYTFAGYLMGSKINYKRINEVATIKLSLYDPTDKAIGKLEVVGNNGDVLVTKNIKEKKLVVTYDVPTSHSFYYIRIVQPDGDMIVTAPVWIGYYQTGTKIANNKVMKSGILGKLSPINLIKNVCTMALGVQNSVKDNSNKESAEKMKVSAVDNKGDISTDDNSGSTGAEWDDFHVMDKPTEDIGTNRIGNIGKHSNSRKNLGLLIAIALVLLVGMVEEFILIMKIKKQM